MPIYSYKCTKCEHTLQQMQKFDDPAPRCPAPVVEGSPEICGGEMTRQMSRSSFQLKGSGWYKTDYS